MHVGADASKGAPASRACAVLPDTLLLPRPAMGVGAHGLGCAKPGEGRRGQHIAAGSSGTLQTPAERSCEQDSRSCPTWSNSVGMLGQRASLLEAAVPGQPGYSPLSEAPLPGQPAYSPLSEAPMQGIPVVPRCPQPGAGAVLPGRAGSSPGAAPAQVAVSSRKLPRCRPGPGAVPCRATRGSPHPPRPGHFSVFSRFSPSVFPAL